MNVDGRRPKIVVRYSASANDSKPAETVHLGRQTRSGGATVHYRLEDFSKPRSTARQSIEEASLLPLPDTSSSSSSSQASSEKFVTPSSIHNSDLSDNDNNSDSDSDGDVFMANVDAANAIVAMSGDNILMPKCFSGRSSDDPETWLHKLSKYAGYKHCTDEHHLDLFKVLLTDIADEWLIALPDGDKDSLAHLTAAFRTRYLENQMSRCRAATNMFDYKQRDQSVDDYATNIVKLALKAGHKRDAETTFQALMVGLRPSIRSAVAMFEPKTITDLIDRARMAEESQPPVKEEQSTVNEIQHEQIKKLIEQVGQLHLKVQDVTTNVIHPPSSTPPASRRVTFDRRNTRATSPQPAGSSARPTDRWTADRRPTNSPTMDRRSNSTYYQQYPEDRGRTAYRGGQRGRQPQASWTSPQFPRYQNSNDANLTCFSCGLRGHRASNCRRSTANEMRRPAQNWNGQFWRGRPSGSRHEGHRPRLTRISENMADGNYIHAKINGKNVRILVDTGANPNVMDFDLAKQLHIQIKPLRQPFSLFPANAGRMPVMGMAYFNMSCQSEMFPTEAYVVQNLSDKILLGRKFLKTYNCTINYTDNSFTID
jgi:hypothetical protein